MVVVIALLLGTWGAGASSDEAGRRQAFEEVEARVKMGVATTQEVESLRDHPLYPYLVYEALTRRPRLADAPAVATFLADHADTPLASRLRSQWLRWLYRRGAWETFLEFFEPTGYTAMACRHLHALAESGDEDAALARAPEVWLAGQSQPDECDPVFALMEGRGHLTPELVWRRIGLAMEAGRPSLATYLKRFLPAADQPWVDLWIAVRRRPETILEDRRLHADHEQAREIVVYGIGRWVRRSPSAAARAWLQIRDRHAFSPAQGSAVARTLGLYLYRRHPHEAMEWLARVTEETADEQVHRARTMGHAKLDDWQGVLEWLDARGPGEEASGRWRYWRARALEATGNGEAARELYSEIARLRSFYGFLAADRLEQPYRLNHRGLEPAAATAARVRALPALARIRELYALGRDLDARREWHHLRTHLDRDELEALAAVAHEQGRHFHAILALGRSESWDYLDVRFPLPHRDVVMARAEAQGLDPAWVFAVARQESAFAPEARSPKGALGLMQLLPGTARSVARDLKSRASSRDLFDVDNNIALGAAYLRGLMERFDDHAVLATAAYNAGPHRVRSWLPEAQPLAADIWVEDIPFYETRKYVKRVFSYTAIYQTFLDATPTRLSARMPPVPPSGTAR
ncbi:MAG: transglycosylase SLT domain-containing protein [Gammaproteobacteria bacterium]|nr:transglycosylase SLT domain-containing protein [Gammaproteobacteria bacterium]